MKTTVPGQTDLQERRRRIQQYIEKKKKIFHFSKDFGRYFIHFSNENKF